MKSILFLVIFFLFPIASRAEPVFKTCESAHRDGNYRIADDPLAPRITTNGSITQIELAGRVIYTPPVPEKPITYDLARLSFTKKLKNKEGERFASVGTAHLLVIRTEDLLDISILTTSKEVPDKLMLPDVKPHHLPRIAFFPLPNDFIDFQILHITRRIEKATGKSDINQVMYITEPLFAILSGSYLKILVPTEGAQGFMAAEILRLPVSNVPKDAKMKFSIRQMERSTSLLNNPLQPTISNETTELSVYIPNQPKDSSNPNRSLDVANENSSPTVVFEIPYIR